MRVTEKKENGFYELKEGQEIYGEENGIRLVQIVGEYEDIKEELGIDLITLFEVLKDKKVWVIYANHISRFYITDIDIKKGIIVGNINIGKSACFEKTYNIKDYDKTWSLTKENLK